MESKNMIIAFTWTFVLVSIVVLAWQGEEISFAGYTIFFGMALFATVAVETLFPGKATELQKELMELRARMDALNGETS